MQLNQTRWHVFESGDDLVGAARDAIAESAAQAIAEHGRFTIVLAGGTTPREVYQQLCHIDTDWSKWQVYFGDERCLPPEHDSRNSRMAEQAWLAHVSIPPSQIHAIPAELGAKDGATAYCQILEGVGEFDIVLLGLGEDGHTASLFPSHPWEAGGAAAIAVFDAPKAPPQRVSLSASRLSLTRKAVFLVTGAGKKNAVRQWKEGIRLPVAAISPADGVEIFLDRAAMEG